MTSVLIKRGMAGVALLVEVSSDIPKGDRFHSQEGYISRLQV